MKEYGLQAKICVHTGISKCVVSRYFNSKYIGNKNKLLIDECLSKMGRNHLKNPNVPVINPDRKKGIRRTDIINNLAKGDQLLLAKMFKSSQSHVNHVLTGSNPRVNQNTELSKNITREAELLAAVNIWKSRFCKFESLI